MSFAHLSSNYTFAELADGIGDVVKHLQATRNDIGLPESDGRQVALYGMQEVLIGFGLTVHSIAGLGLKSRTAAEVEESFENYVSIEGKDDTTLLAIAETVWRLSVLSLFHFKLDALFQNLLRSLGNTPGKSGFGVNSKTLLGLITLTDATRVLSILECLTNVRNSLHNNGIHRNIAWGPWSADDLTFHFVQDQPVSCASFGHILTIIDSTVNALSAILKAPKIAALVRVDDLYANLLDSS